MRRTVLDTISRVSNEITRFGVPIAKAVGRTETPSYILFYIICSLFITDVLSTLTIANPYGKHS